MGVGYQVFFQEGWGSYKLGCPSLFNIPTGGLTSWDVQVCSTYQPPPWTKNLINYSQGGARKISSYHSGALTIALLSWPSFHQDILEKTVCWKVERKSCPTFGLLTLVFNFQIENLETNFWEGPKSRKLERKIMSYVRAFKFGFQLWFWIFKAKKTWQEPVQPSRGKKVIKRYASSNRVQRVDLPPRKGILRVRIADFGRWSPLLWRGGW